MNCVGFYSLNTVRMLTADISCGIYDYAVIPLYNTLGEESIDYILKQTKLQVMLLSLENLKKIVKKYKDAKDIDLKYLVVLNSDECTENIKIFE